MRRSVLVAGILATLFVGDATAAGTARLDIFPDRPRAGEIATIQLRTYWTYPTRRPPAVFPNGYPMRVAAFAPNGGRTELGLVRDTRDPHLWRGTFRFPASGRWTVCGANFQPSLYQRCPTTNPTRLLVQVAPRTAGVDVWHRLQRPFTTPSITSISECPVASPKGDLRSRPPTSTTTVVRVTVPASRAPAHVTA